MSGEDNNNFFDVNIKHKYDSTDSKKRRRIIYSTIVVASIAACSPLMMFSNVVSSNSETTNTLEDISGRTSFPETITEADMSGDVIPCMSTTSVIVESAPLEMEIPAESDPADIPITDNATVTMKSSEIKIQSNKASKSKKDKKKSKKSKNRKKEKQKKKKKKKVKSVFANVKTKDQKAKAIWTCLEKEGYEDGAIAGILGNIEQESNFNEKHSSNNENKYKGMFQLSKYDRFQNCINWCAEKGYDPWSVKGQLYFMLEEMDSREVRTFQFKHFTGYDKTEYKNIKSPEKAASVWVAGYEGAISSGSGLNATWQQEEKRRQHALKWYKKFT